MKASISKRLVVRKYERFQNQFLILVLLFGCIFSDNAVSASSDNELYNYNPPKVISTIDCLPPVTIASIQPTKSGNWNDVGIWPGNTLPTSNDDVTIPEGTTVTLSNTCRAKSIRVNGVLNAANQAIDLETQSIVVAGKMEIGTTAQPYSAAGKCLIKLTGNKRTNPSSDYKAILVVGGGTLELHGKKRKSWTNIATTADAGATKIVLRESVDWEVGDKIALTATGLANGGTKLWNNVDEAEIKDISNDKKTLTLRSALKYKHVGGSKSYTRPTDGKTWNVDIFGEVGLLSHYIKIEGKMDGNNQADGFGGHIMLMKNSTAHVEHVELYKMGQKAILGRYPFHWHLNEDKAKGSYFKNSSVYKSFNRAVTIHGTDYVTVDGIFAYDHIGHGIFLEDGGERFNTIKNNVVFLTRRPKKGEELTPSDNERYELQNRTPSSYWITNPNNYFENNVAAGTEGTGFWFAFPRNGPLFDSGQLDYYKGMVPWKEPLGRFDGFVVHTCMNGFDMFDQLNDNHGLIRNFGWDIKTEQYIENGLLYGNEQAVYCGLGANGDPTKIVFRDCAFSDNKTISMLAADITLQNCLFNVDTELGVFNGTREFYKFYDGPGRHFDCHFEGWNRGNAEMIQQKEGAGATENFNPTFRGITKGSPEPFRFRFPNFGNPKTVRARKAALNFKDYDGSFLGKPGTLIRDIPFNRDGHEYRHASWKNAARSDYYFASIWMNGINGTAPAISVLRSKPGTENVCYYEPGSSKGTYKFGLIVNQGFMYTYTLSKIPSSKKIQVFMYRGDPGDLTLLRYRGLGKLSGFGVSGSNIKKLNSRAAVEASKDLAYYIDGNGDVYIQMKAIGGNRRTLVELKWNGNGSYQQPALSCTTNDFTPGENTNPLSIVFQRPTADKLEVGDDLGVVVDVVDGSANTIRLYINDVFVRQEGVAPYEWGAANPGQNDEELLNLAEGTYVLKAVGTDSNGAATTITKTITVTDDTLSVNEIEDQNTSVLAPNPVNSILTINGITKNKLVKVYDLLGALKISESLNKNDNTVDFSELSNGIYMVRIIDLENHSTDQKTYKIVKTD